MFKNRSKVLFVGTLLATLYTIYLIIYFNGAIGSGDTSEAIGGAIATALVTPHMLMTGLGAVFGWIGFATRKTWGALVGAILYCVAAILFIMYAFFAIPSIVLGFIGYSNQKKINKNNPVEKDN